MNILVIAAHPDDEVLGCGGTVAALADQGAHVSILILAQGLTSRADFDSERGAAKLDIHRARAHEAGCILGAHEVIFGEFPDQKMDTIPLLDITTHRTRNRARAARVDLHASWWRPEHGSCDHLSCDSDSDSSNSRQ